jgi:hypothetical protein
MKRRTRVLLADGHAIVAERIGAASVFFLSLAPRTFSDPLLRTFSHCTNVRFLYDAI